jgi:hypothetical protein
LCSGGDPVDLQGRVAMGKEQGPRRSTRAGAGSPGAPALLRRWSSWCPCRAPAAELEMRRGGRAPPAGPPPRAPLPLLPDGPWPSSPWRPL